MSFLQKGAPTRFPGGVNIGEPTSFSGRLIEPDRTSVFEHFDDFNFLDTDEWLTTLGQGPGSIVVNGESGGKLQFDTDNAVTSDLQAIQLLRNNVNLLTNNEVNDKLVWFKCRFKIDTDQTDTGLSFGVRLALPGAPGSTVSLDTLGGASSWVFRTRHTSDPDIFTTLFGLFDLIVESNDFNELAWLWNGRDGFDIYFNNEFFQSVNIGFLDIPSGNMTTYFSMDNGADQISTSICDYTYLGKER